MIILTKVRIIFLGPEGICDISVGQPIYTEQYDFKMISPSCIWDIKHIKIIVRTCVFWPVISTRAVFHAGQM